MIVTFLLLLAVIIQGILVDRLRHQVHSLANANRMLIETLEKLFRKTSN